MSSWQRPFEFSCSRIKPTLLLVLVLLMVVVLMTSAHSCILQQCHYLCGGELWCAVLFSACSFVRGFVFILVLRCRCGRVGGCCWVCRHGCCTAVTVALVAWDALVQGEVMCCVAGTRWCNAGNVDHRRDKGLS